MRVILRALLDNFLDLFLSRHWSGWREALVFVGPETVMRWRRRRFRDHWRRLSRRGVPGRPAVPAELRRLIRRMSTANPLWGSPRIEAELRMLGIEVARTTVAKYMVRHRLDCCKETETRSTERCSVNVRVVWDWKNS